MVRQRIQEVVDFATTESPYKDANKGWITNDVFLQWGVSTKPKSKSGVELANVSVLWKPINQLASILLAVVLSATTFVFIAVSISHGNLKLKLVQGNSQPISQSVAVSEKKVESDQAIGLAEDSVVPNFGSVIEKKVESGQAIGLVPVSGVANSASVFESQADSEQFNRNIDFASAALGGQKIQR